MGVRRSFMFALSPVIRGVKRRYEVVVECDCIWFAESAYNIRKPHTMEASAVYKSNPMYLRIVPYLNKARDAEFIKHIIKAILTIF